MTQRIVSEELLHNIQDAVIRLKPFVSGLGKAVLREIEIDVASALEQPAVEPPSDLKAKWLGCALFDCIKASRIIRDDINELSVAELLHFAQDLKGQLERTAPQAPQPSKAVKLTPEEMKEAVRPLWPLSAMLDNALSMYGDEYRAIEQAVLKKNGIEE